MPHKISGENNIKNPENRPKKKFRDSFGILSDWLNLICLLFALGTAIWAVEQAQWAQPSPSFITLFIVAALTGFVLAKSHLPAFIAHVISIAVGIMVLFWQGLLLVSGTDLLSRVINFIGDIQNWWYSQINNIPSSNTLHIALIFGFLVWLIGYFSIWPLIKNRNPWIAVLLGTATILLNLNFEKSDKYYYFVIFIVSALALIAVANFTKHYARVVKNIRKDRNWGTKLWGAAAICLIIIATSVTWVSPGFRIAAIADYSRSNSPFNSSFQLFWQNFFATVPGSGSPVLMHGGQGALQLGGPLKLNDQVDYILKTDYQTYWKTQAYDYYDSTGWKTTAVDSQVVNPGVNEVGTSSGSPGARLSYTVIPQVNTDVIPTTGDFVSGSIPITEKTLAPKVFDIVFANPASFVQLPDDILPVARSLMAVNESGRRNKLRWMKAVIPSDLELVSDIERGGQILSVSIARRQSEVKDEIALTSAKVIVHQKTANITVTLPPKVSTDELKSDSTNYPKQITDQYLQLPLNLPGRIKQLARSITGKSITEYDKVQAVKNYLGNFEYNLDINAPPAGTDAVDYFLFQQKAGYCTYFASAMAVMLRSVGIPARLVVGFLPGQYDPEIQGYVVRDRDYHAWTEVYFPVYGWIDFDATPSSSGGSGGYSVYYILPNNPASSAQGNSQGTSPNSPSTPINFAYYIELAAGTIAGILLLLIIVFCFWIYSRPKNNSAMYSRMVRLSSLAGLGPKRWQTALEFSGHLSAALPENAVGINKIAQNYIVTCYSDRASAVASVDEIEGSWPEIRNTLIKRWLHIEWLLKK